MNPNYLQQAQGSIGGGFSSASMIGAQAPQQVSLTTAIHDEISRIQECVSALEQAFHGGMIAQLPSEPATTAPGAPCLKGILEAAHNRLRGIRARIEALAGASASF